MSREPEKFTDGQIMSLLANGEMDALGQLYIKYGSIARTAIVRAAPEISIGVLDELTQDVFLTISDKAKLYRERNRLQSWIYSIGARKGRTWRRNTWLRRRLLKANSGVPVAMAIASQSCPDRALRLKQVVGQMLKRLPANQVEVLLMHVVEGFSGEEIADILHIRHETVRSRLFRARKLLTDSVNAPAWSEVLEE